MKCKVRDWNMEDAVALANALNNKNVQDRLRDGLPYPYTEGDARTYIQRMLDSDKTTSYAFAITVDDYVIGSIGVFRKENIHRMTGEMGYYIAEEYWGKGIGTQAIQQVCSYIFDHTDIIRIFAEPFANNLASCRALEKSGFICEGTMHKNAIKNGVILDMKLYARIKE